MPKRKKPEKSVHEMTTDELAASVFPKKVHEHLKEIAHGETGKITKRSSQK